MFSNIEYNRFSSNPNRSGFNSVKKRKPQKYMSVKLINNNELNNELNQIESVSPEYDSFNKIEFSDDDQKLHEIYEEKTDLFEKQNMMTEIETVSENIKHVEHELLKMKSIVKFLDNHKSQKIKKFEKKYK